MKDKLDISKKLSEIIEKISNAFMDLGIQIDLAFEVGRQEGLTDIEIGDIVRQKLKGIKSLPTIRKMLPETARHSEKVRHDYVKEMNTSPPQARLVTDEEPNIPPPPQVVRELEPEPPKPIDEPISIPKSNIVKQIFDPSMMDRNERSHVFVLYINLSSGKIIKYETIGRNMIGKLLK